MFANNNPLHAQAAAASATGGQNSRAQMAMANAMQQRGQPVMATAVPVHSMGDVPPNYSQSQGISKTPQYVQQSAPTLLPVRISAFMVVTGNILTSEAFLQLAGSLYAVESVTAELLKIEPNAVTVCSCENEEGISYEKGTVSFDCTVSMQLNEYNEALSAIKTSLPEWVAICSSNHLGRPYIGSHLVEALQANKNLMFPPDQNQTRAPLLDPAQITRIRKAKFSATLTVSASINADALRVLPGAAEAFERCVYDHMGLQGHHYWNDSVTIIKISEAPDGRVAVDFDVNIVVMGTREQIIARGTHMMHALNTTLGPPFIAHLSQILSKIMPIECIQSFSSNLSIDEFRQIPNIMTIFTTTVANAATLPPDAVHVLSMNGSGNEIVVKYALTIPDGHPIKGNNEGLKALLSTTAGPLIEAIRNQNMSQLFGRDINFGQGTQYGLRDLAAIGGGLSPEAQQQIAMLQMLQNVLGGSQEPIPCHNEFKPTSTQGVSKYEYTPGCPFTMLYLPFPFLCMGCFLFKSSDLTFDDNKNMLNAKTWSGHLHLFGGGCVDEQNIEYDQIGKVGWKTTNMEVNGVPQYAIVIVKKNGSQIATGRTGNGHAETYGIALEWHRFIFGRNDPNYVKPAPSSLQV